MNIQSILSRIYNTIRFNQIPEEEVQPHNITRMIYMAGMLDASKLFMSVYNDEVTEQEIEVELAKLKRWESVN